MFRSALVTTQTIVAAVKVLVIRKSVQKTKIKPLGRKLWPNQELVNAIFHDAVSLIDLKVL